MKATAVRYLEEDAVLLSCETYEAVILPRFGANCISLCHIPTGYHFLREPESQNELASKFNVYGLPLLFPANRIRNGHYTFEGRSYDFPINEPARNHHIHGFLSSTAFEQVGEASFRYEATAENPYLAFSHSFSVVRSYTLDEEGLHHSLIFRNNSNTDMPMGTGIHASWNAGFCPSVSAADACLEIPVIRQWEYDPITIIPTLETIAESDFLSELRNGTFKPENQAVSALLECENRPIRLKNEKGSFCCQPDSHYPFVMLWNGGGGKKFVCPEPQTWLVDAPNLQLPAEKSGFSFLKPGEERVYTVDYWFESAADTKL